MKSYIQTHSNKVNLLIHGVAVPLFIMANVSLVVSVVKLKPIPALASVGLMSLSLGLQRKGHGLEQESPKAFKNVWDFSSRLYKEQFYTFPKFVLSGHFKENLLAASKSFPPVK
jgi:hypothetical protein